MRLYSVCVSVVFAICACSGLCAGNPLNTSSNTHSNSKKVYKHDYSIKEPTKSISLTKGDHIFCTGGDE